jgi:hypothetical protein
MPGVRGVVAIKGRKTALEALDAFFKMANGSGDASDVHGVFVADYFMLPRADPQPRSKSRATAAAVA